MSAVESSTTWICASAKVTAERFELRLELRSMLRSQLRSEPRGLSSDRNWDRSWDLRWDQSRDQMPELSWVQSWAHIWHLNSDQSFDQIWDQVKSLTGMPGKPIRRRSSAWTRFAFIVLLIEIVTLQCWKKPKLREVKVHTYNLVQSESCVQSCW